MVAQNEETPLLREQARNINGSPETLAESRRGEDGEDFEDDDKANQRVGRWRGFLIILSMWGLIFLQASNMSGITTTQSQIAEDLDAFASASWFTSAYLIAMSSTSPLCARLAQIFSPRSCVFVSSLFFALGGILTSQASSLGVFLAGRAVQGLGGAGIMTISFILVLELVSKKRRGLYIGLANTGFTTGVSFGAVVAGALLNTMGWRFLFWIQSPLALLFGISIFFSIPGTFSSGEHGAGEGSMLSKLAKIDYLGAFALILSLSLFLFGLSGPNVVLTPIITSIIFLILFIFIELRVAADPIIPIIVLKSRGALLSCVAQLGIMTARWSVLFFTPVYAIAVRGWSPTAAGSILLPTNIGFALGGILVGVLHIKRGGSFWLPSIIVYTLFACTLAVLSQISSETTPPLLYFLCVFFNGLCIGSALNYTLAHLLHLTPPSTHFISTSLLTTFRGFAGSFGSAIGGGLFIRVLKSHLEAGFSSSSPSQSPSPYTISNTANLTDHEDLIRRLLGSPALVQTLSGWEKDVAVQSYESALKAIFLSGVGLALVMVVVQASTGWEDGAKRKEEENAVGERASLRAWNGEEEEEEEEWEEGLEQGV